MANYWDEFSRSRTNEVAATIGRIDDLIGPAHWLSVGTYKESVIRKQLIDYLPGRYSVGTGFVLHDIGPRVLSRQIDVLVWDSQDYAPIFRDGSFVIIHPQSLRIAIEVKGNLTLPAFEEALENLDSLSPFLSVIDENHSADPHARHGFLRFVVAGGSDVAFPDPFLDRLYRYYIRCIYDKNEPTEIHVQLTMEERDQRTALWGLTPWISGVAILRKGMLRIVKVDDTAGYVISNDAEQDCVDHTIGLIQRAIDRFLTNDLVKATRKDYAYTTKESERKIMPVPFREVVQNWRDGLIHAPPDRTWTLEDAIAAKQKRDERRRRRSNLDAEVGAD
jgi:hypothetical protein